MNFARVIARCPKCGGEVLATGLCANPDCTPFEASVERLRRYAVVKKEPGARGQVSGGKKVKAPKQRDFLGGQDAALPVGDRE